MMSPSRTAAPQTPAFDDARGAWPDARLVRECIAGSEEAWCALIFKYKNLIFSIPVKYGFSADDSTDIFQAVCLDLLSELPNLRKVKALPKWIMQVTAHKCFHRNNSNNARTFWTQAPRNSKKALRPAPKTSCAKRKMNKDCA